MLLSLNWIAQERVSLSKFELYTFLTKIGVPDLLPLQQEAVAYRLQYTAEELLSSMADTMHAAPKMKANESQFMTVFIDQPQMLCSPNY